jgi:aminomethyltransferase
VEDNVLIFLAFDTHKLNDGIESIIDDKATRTVHG